MKKKKASTITTDRKAEDNMRWSCFAMGTSTSTKGDSKQWSPANQVGARKDQMGIHIVHT